jgi:hypothetical protein
MSVNPLFYLYHEHDMLSFIVTRYAYRKINLDTGGQNNYFIADLDGVEDDGGKNLILS